MLELDDAARRQVFVDRSRFVSFQWLRFILGERKLPAFH
jgi:hypothetical protein